MSTKKEKTDVQVTEYNEDSMLNVENGDPNYSYYWASTQAAHPQNVNRMKRLGFEVVSEDSPEFATYGEKSGGAVRVNELVLMRIPKEQGERLQRKRLQAFRERMNMLEAEFDAIGGDADGVTKETLHVGNSGGGRRSFFIPNNPISKRG